MFNFRKGKKVNLNEITNILNRRNYEFEVVPEKNIVIVHGKYKNYDKEFKKLYLHFSGGNVSFKDARGRFISHIPQSVDLKNMYYQILNIFGIPCDIKAL